MASGRIRPGSFVPALVLMAQALWLAPLVGVVINVSGRFGAGALPHALPTDELATVAGFAAGISVVLGLLELFYMRFWMRLAHDDYGTAPRI